MIDLGGGRYLLMGHLRQDSITVDVGQQVTEGEPIARVGNSGHTSHPHLHIRAQTLPTGISDITTVDGPRLVVTLHTYPLLFRGAGLIRGGVETWPTAADPAEATSSVPRQAARSALWLIRSGGPVAGPSPPGPTS